MTHWFVWIKDLQMSKSIAQANIQEVSVYSIEATPGEYLVFAFCSSVTDIPIVEGYQGC
jgi:hypothetical protein